MTYSVVSKPGSREINEDSAAIIQNEKQICFVVADGLGGHGRGDEASKIVVQTFQQAFQSFNGSVSAIERALLQAQSNIIEEQEKKAAAYQMKTTAAVLVIDEGALQWAYIGDTRIYYFSNNHLRSRTLDHSVPQMLVYAGEIKEKEIRFHPDRNKLLRVLGVAGEVPRFEVAAPIAIKKGQSFLICSDGFWEFIDEKRMCSELKKTANAEEWLKAMTADVERAGNGKDMDNYSAIAIRL